MGRDGGNRQKQGFREKFCLYCTGQVCTFWKGQCGSLTINYTVKSGERDGKGSFPGSETDKRNKPPYKAVGRPGQTWHPQAPRGFCPLPGFGPWGWLSTSQPRHLLTYCNSPQVTVLPGWRSHRLGTVAPVCSSGPSLSQRLREGSFLQAVLCQLRDLFSEK